MKTNILFINLPAISIKEFDKIIRHNSTIYQPISMPLGIMYISSYLKKNNISNINNIGILDYVSNVDQINKYKSVKEFILNIAKKNINFVPDILAFSLIFSASHPFFNLCVKILKSIYPHAIVIVGGTHATNCCNLLIKNKYVDYVLRGEGEIGFSEFIKQYSNSDYINVKGIYFKQNINNTKNLEITDYIVDLDCFPFPDWDLINMNKYITNKGRKKNIGNVSESKLASIVTTRGCPFMCTFCASHTVHGRNLRFRSVENIISEIKLLYNKYDVTLFIPEDDLFTAKEDRVIKLLSEVKSLKIPNLQLQFTNALSIHTLNKNIMDALIDTNMNIVYLAIESGSNYIQKYVIKKNVDLIKTKEIVKYLKSKGVIVRCYVILGFPTETKKQMYETINYVKSIGVDWCSFCIATPLLGTEMYNQFIELGYIKDNMNIWANTTFTERKFDTKEILAKELNELVYKANIDCNFINNTNKINGLYQKAINLYKDIVETYPFHIIGWYCMMECYKFMNDIKNVKQIKDKINKLIKDDKRANEMFIKYSNLMPEISK